LIPCERVTEMVKALTGHSMSAGSEHDETVAACGRSRD
jgi:hypothetical protein